MARIPNALPAGFQLEGYRLQDVLGSGGFGITYSAVESLTKRKVAIKEFMPYGVAVRDTDGVSVRVNDTPDAESYEYGVSSFRREAQTLVTFRHPNIVSVLRYFEANNTAYLVMEHEEGQSLAKLIYGRQGMQEAQLRNLLMPILDGLEAVHNAGFLHRDLKPDNIYVRQDGSPVLIDFGSARQAISEKTRSLTTVLTPGYAPLEQYSSHGNQGPWTDIYALAACLYLAVTGRRPMDAPARVGNDPVKPATEAAAGKYSPALLEAIDAGLGVTETERPQSIADFRILLQGDDNPDAETLVATADKSPVSRPAAIHPRRRRLAPMAALAVLLAAGTGMAAGVAVLDDDLRSWIVGAKGNSNAGTTGRVASRTPGESAAPSPAIPKPSEEELQRKKEEELKRKREEEDRIRREQERQEKLEKEKKKEAERQRQREQRIKEEERRKAKKEKQDRDRKREQEKKEKAGKTAAGTGSKSKKSPPATQTKKVVSKKTVARSKTTKRPSAEKARSKAAPVTTKTAAKPKVAQPPSAPKCFTFNGARHCE